MPARRRISSWFIPLLIPLLILILAACADEEATPASPPETPAQETPVAAAEQAPESVTEQNPAPVDQAPIGLQIKSAPSPAIDPACLAGGEAFQLLSDLPPGDAIEPGVGQLFCVTGAPAGATVVFTLVDPKGAERTFEVESISQGDITVAPLSVRLLADDAPGAWTLRASGGDDAALQSELTFDVQESTEPFITLLEPIVNNTNVIRAGIGGLLPESTARFALYTLDAASLSEDGMMENQANLLISTRLVADSAGRADLELDVADLPAGPYLLMLIPPGEDLGSPPILNLPDQERLAIAANLTRSQVTEVAEVPAEGETEATGEQAAPSESTAPETPVTAEAETEAETPATDNQSTTPVLVEGPMGVPRSMKVNLPIRELPSCLTTSAPTLQIWPATGEIGDWWYGCATGFAPNKDVQFVVTLPSGEQTQFDLESNANGTTPFRWYAAPGEGVGQYKVFAQNQAGSAELSWEITEASKPHVLVFPHNFESKTGGEIYLSGFPAQKDVKIGLFQIDEQGEAKKVTQWRVTTTGAGFYGARFTQTEDLGQGHYVLIAQSEPTYQFPGVDTPASAIEFFSLNVAPKPSNDAYSLFLNRPPETLIASQPAATPEPAPAPEETPTEATTDAAEADQTPEAPAEEAAPVVTDVPPATYSLPEDDGEIPTCPGATPGESAVCVLPATMQQGTFAYILMHDFAPRTRFGVTITAPNGAKDTLERRTANSDGYADAYWYALYGEPLGEYRIDINGGGENFSGNLEIVEATSPHLLIQPRSPKVGSNFNASLTGFDANEELLLAFYRSENIEDGNINFKLVGQESLRTDDNGGANKQFQTTRNQKGIIFLVLAYRAGESEPAAQAVYRPGKELGPQYPFAWGQNYQEGQ